MNERITYPVILAAKHGDAEAMNAILQHYRGYIAHYSKRTFYDEYGTPRCFVDEDMRQRIEEKLMLQIIFRFDPFRLPEGERLEDEEWQKTLH